MISDYWAAVLIGVAIGIPIGAGLSQLIRFRRVRRGGRTLIVPELDRRPLRLRLKQWRDRLASSPPRPWTLKAIIALMVLAVVGGLVQNTLFNMHQRDCNADFVSTTLELREIATRDRELENRDDGLRNARDDLLSALVNALAEPPPAFTNPEAYSRKLLQDYNAAVAGLDVERKKLITERKDLEDQRKAQPTPRERC